MMAPGWLAEFALESAGAIMYRRRSRLLCFILAFCAATDLIAALMKPNFSSTFIFGQYAWAQFALKELFLIWLGCTICGMFVAEKQKSIAIISTGFISFATGVMVTVFAFQGETLKDRLLNGVIAANTAMLATVILAYIGRRVPLNYASQVILAGFVAMVGGDWLLTICWKPWMEAQNWQQIPTLIGYGIWVLGPLRSVRLPEFRQSLGQRVKEVEKVSLC